jgi:perosamine synthetase
VDPTEFGRDRDSLAQRLKEKGVATGVHYPRGLHQQPIFEELYGKSKLPHTEYVAQHILALPVHHGLSPEEARWVVEAVRDGQG